MIECKICNRQFKRLGKYHLINVHQISIDDYKLKFPDAKLIDDSTIEKYSKGTIRYFSVDENRTKHVYKRTPEIIKLQLDKRQNTIKSNPDIKASMYLPERNLKISKAKAAWWKTLPFELRSQINKKNKNVQRMRMNDPEYCKLHPEKYKEAGRYKLTKFESEMYNILYLNNIQFIKQFKLEYKYYDCFIPSKNLLIEFDGDYWHPLSLDECIHDSQINNYYNDIYKNELAKENGYELIRIRLSEKYLLEKLIPYLKCT